jgi:hypothetical protein
MKMNKGERGLPLTDKKYATVNQQTNLPITGLRGTCLLFCERTGYHVAAKSGIEERLLAKFFRRTMKLHCPCESSTDMFNFHRS